MYFRRIFHGKESQDMAPTPKSTTPQEEALVLIVEVSKDTAGTWHCDVQNHSTNTLDFDEAHKIVLEMATRHLTLNTPLVVPTEPTLEVPPEPAQELPPQEGV